MTPNVSSVRHPPTNHHTDEASQISAASKHDVAGLEAILDYAIAEGTQMGFSFFVSLLRLARMALKEESEKAVNHATQSHSS
ncbi:MAG: hypothetical protein ACM3W7_07095 [Acidobacteriota bacterium]